MKTKFFPLMYISLPIPPFEENIPLDKNHGLAIDINSLLNYFVEPKLEESEGHECCLEPIVYSKMDFWKLPPLLII